MFNLESRIYLQEQHATLATCLVQVDEEFKGADVTVATGLGHTYGGVQNLFPLHAGQARTGGDLQQLLVLSLQGALPLPEVTHPFAVTNDLYLHMAGALNHAFNIKRAVSKGAFGLRLTALVSLCNFAGVVNHPHSLAATTADRLDDHGLTGAQ